MHAKELRKDSTEAERILWKYLRNRRLNGLKFRRQHPLDIFVADFYCHEKRLIIELDGGVHDIPEQKEYDDGRTYILEERGFRILRFSNEEIIYDVNNVLERILIFAKK